MNTLAVLGNETVTGVLNAVKNIPVLKPADVQFLQEKSQHLAKVIEKTHMWRTDTQKASIINDVHFPTDHAKFHQAMLEQKVQFDQAMYLAKDFEMKKLDIEEKELEFSELGNTPKDDIRRRKLALEIQFMHYELHQMKIAMNFRMDEVRGWQSIQEEILTQLRESGLDEESIWSKNQGELKPMFLLSLNNLQALPTTTDSAERSNLISLAVFTYKNVVNSGLLAEFSKDCTPAQLDSLNWVSKQSASR